MQSYNKEFYATYLDKPTKATGRGGLGSLRQRKEQEMADKFLPSKLLLN